MLAKRYFLNGIDYFQLLIDHHGKKKGGRGHEAHLNITLEGHVEKSTVLLLFQQNKLIQQLIALRISKIFGFGYPSVYKTKKHSEVPVSFFKIDSSCVPSENLNFSIDPFTQPSFYLQVIYLNNNTTSFLFTFHHILFDFAGVQSFICSLSGMSTPVLFKKPVRKRTLAKRFAGFFREVAFTFKEANAKMTTPSAKLPFKKPFEIEYREIIFTEEEYRLITAKAASEGVALNNSIYFLTACCMSLHNNIFSKQAKHEFIWIPVPVNNRLKGQTPSIIFNGLTFLFYKIDASELSDKSSVIQILKKQMSEQIRNDMPNAFIDFVEGYKYMPMPFYYPMLNLPSWGKLSSFSFSVLGITFEGLDSLLGHQILDIKNYPSNSISPGITFLFYNYKNELRLTSSWVKGQYSNDVQESVLKNIRELLLE